LPFVISFFDASPICCLAGVYKLSDKDADNRLHIMYLSDKEAFT